MAHDTEQDPFSDQTDDEALAALKAMDSPAPSAPTPEVASEMVHTYELPQSRTGNDSTVFTHDQDDLMNAIRLELDSLEDGESVTITYRKRTPEQMEELYGDE